jgi:hypothetical protein
VTIAAIADTHAVIWSLQVPLISRDRKIQSAGFETIW